MTLEQKGELLTQALAASVRGCSVSPDRELSEAEWEELFALTREQKLQSLFMEAVYGCLEEYPELKKREGDVSRYLAMRQMRQDMTLARLYPVLQSKGFTVLPVKGLLCRSLYPQGELRPSGDEDLLVPPEQFADCCRCFRELGWKAEKEGEDEGEAELAFNSPDGSLHVELHQYLFDPDSRLFKPLNDGFRDCFSRRRSYAADFVTVEGMSPHDHMLYLFGHAFKHFIHSGFGLRQLCDIGLWAERYEEDIDWPRLWQQLEEFRALPFACAVLQTGKNKLGLAEGVSLPKSVSPETCEGLLADLLQGGVYGNADASHSHSATLTLRAAETGKAGGLLPTLFPGKDRLTGQYPVLKKHPALLPAVWLHRLGRYGTRLITEPRGNSAGESVKIAGQRLELLRQLEVIQ